MSSIAWDAIFGPAKPICVQSPCAPPTATSAPVAGQDHTDWYRERDKRLADAQAKHTAAAKAEGLGGPGLLEQANAVLQSVYKSPEVAGIGAAFTNTVSGVGSVLDRFALPAGLLVAGAGVVALVLVLRR